VKVAWILVIGAVWNLLANAQPSKMVHVNDSFNGRQIELHVGETLEISLSENASTGFQWITAPESAHKLDRILHQAESAVKGADNPLGKPGVRRFYFEAFEPGAVELELDYRRPWETAKPPARKFKLHIRVRSASED
jgi:inhibitor of cysteine peptidase